jgi:hypothetical protein
MAIDFPSSPTDGQTFSTANGVTYIYQTSVGAWVSNLVGAANTVSMNNFTSVNGTFTGSIAFNANVKFQSLSDSTSTISWDTSQGTIGTVTLTGTGRTVAAPTNLKVGTLILHIYQDATGGRTITAWNSIFKWPAGTAWTASNTSPNAHDVISFVCDGTNLYGSFLPDVR